ncbi:MAG: Glyoxalase/bleomycin resistance protein/dioxygenase [Enterovirga sp.]|nr:Glyoxalase/bleomycin resistance protein/dioxygenase [Enterovirga sp.]
MSDLAPGFVWYELMTTDVPAAEAFYRAVVGWSARDSGVPGVAYTMFTAGEAPAAGLMSLDDATSAAGARPGWIGYVAVPDVDASVAKLQHAGGAVHRAPADIPTVGRFAIVADPQGAVLAMITPSMEGTPPKPGTPGHGGWHELLTTDREGAMTFYAGLFGWTKDKPFDMGPMGIYQIFAQRGQAIGGIMTKPDAIPAPFWNYYFTVEGIDAATARIGQQGGQVINGPHEVPGGSWIVQGLDPQGAMFSLTASAR